jgi:hypothetical protein
LGLTAGIAEPAALLLQRQVNQQPVLYLQLQLIPRRRRCCLLHAGLPAGGLLLHAVQRCGA